MPEPSAPPAYSPPVYGAGTPFTQNINISVNTSSPPATTEQQTEVAQRMLKSQQPRASKSFLGRMVQRFTESRKCQKATAYTREAFRPLKEMAIDICSAMKILGKETWKGTTWGILGGFGAGVVVTALCPPLVGTAFTAGITSGATAGGIIGCQIGLDKAIDYFNAARKARKEEAELIQQQQLNTTTNPFDFDLKEA